jgi:hypothetical protein
VALQIAGLLFVWRSKDYDIFRKKYLVDAVALLVLFILHLIITTQFSPLHLKKALFTKFSEEIPVQAPLYKGFSLAKQFVFSTFDHSEWAAVVNPPITLASPLSQLITFLFNLPSIDPVTFHVVIDSITFLLIVGGAFGCYLFLKYAAKVCSILSWFGGALMFFSAANYLWLMIWADGGIFLSSYAMLPYCLLFLTLACEKRRYYLAAWAGVAMASPFFILTPHPEGVIYTALCVGLFALGLIFFSPYGNWKQRFLLTTAAFTTFALLSAYVVVPMFIDQWGGNMYTFAHTSDIEANYPLHPEYLKLLKIFIPLSALLLTLRRKIYPAYLPALFFCLLINLLLYATTFLQFNNAVVNILHIGVHLWMPWRLSLFAILSLFLVVIMCLDGAIRVTVNILQMAGAIVPSRFYSYCKNIGFILFVAKDNNRESI